MSIWVSFFGPGGVDFVYKKLVEKVEGNKVEKKWPNGPMPIIGRSNSGAPGSLGRGKGR